MGEDLGKNHLHQWKKGDPILAADLNKISDFASNLTFTAQAPLYFRQINGSLMLYLRKFTTGGSSAFPFKVYSKSSGSTGAIAINFNDGFVGQVNSITPQIGGVDIGPPDNPLLTISGDGAIYLNCTFTGSSSISAISVNLGTQPSQTATHAYITIATITDFTAGTPPTFTINQVVTHSLFFRRCGGTNDFWAV